MMKNFITEETADISEQLKINEDDFDGDSTSSDEVIEDTERNVHRWYTVLNVPNTSRYGK